MIGKLKKYQFLFEELVKRDFKKKYKRTVLGMGWSILSPLLVLLVMKIIFTQFFGRTMTHDTTYLFCGLLTFNWFSESTNPGGLPGDLTVGDLLSDRYATKARNPEIAALFSHGS